MPSAGPAQRYPHTPPSFGQTGWHNGQNPAADIHRGSVLTRISDGAFVLFPLCLVTDLHYWNSFLAYQDPEFVPCAVSSVLKDRSPPVLSDYSSCCDRCFRLFRLSSQVPEVARGVASECSPLIERCHRRSPGIVFCASKIKWQSFVRRAMAYVTRARGMRASGNFAVTTARAAPFTELFPRAIGVVQAPVVHCTSSGALVNCLLSGLLFSGAATFPAPAGVQLMRKCAFIARETPAPLFTRRSFVWGTSSVRGVSAECSANFVLRNRIARYLVIFHFLLIRYCCVSMPCGWWNTRFKTNEPRIRLVVPVLTGRCNAPEVSDCPTTVPHLASTWPASAICVTARKNNASIEEPVAW